jgi:hypothetical protein
MGVVGGDGGREDGAGYSKLTAFEDANADQKCHGRMPGLCIHN